ncbi:hypothetical protein [Jannaschia seohaensis]|uniref:Right handed beta helix region n=1 Tax=Jannaschia seohaensis TaxID=475081 RepID=A0A2Y9B6V3_9RHOB|nr:hypothetical protein [Jannaschia seohaensis]PWJ12899.1 hypothetical protein BCF38_11535 [Jannaschia seohaensis]SSA50707.1 hypothetical protein SAMN05421539_11535 [Jannaschia seohaensis]
MRGFLRWAGAVLPALSVAAVLAASGSTRAGDTGPGAAVFGLRNLAGEAAVPTPLPDGTYRAGGGVFAARGGLLRPAAALGDAVPGRHRLTGPGGMAQELILRAGARCVSTTGELRAVLALSVAEKSGLTVCLNPGRYMDLDGRDFPDAFLDPEARAPIVFEATDPEARPVLNMWMMRSTDPDRPNGGVVLRDLDFLLDDVPALPPGATGFVGIRSAVTLASRGETRAVLLERLHVRGTLGQARAGQTELERNLSGIRGLRLRDVVIRDNRFEGIVNAIAVGGTGIVVEDNRMRHSWGDFLRLSPQLLGGGDCAETRGVTVRRNVMSHVWSNNRIHPDFVHLFAASNVSCDVSDVLIEGNIAFPGRDGLLQPGFGAGLRGTPPGPVPARLPADDRVQHRLIGPGRATLPAPDCADGRGPRFGVQSDPTSAGPIRLEPPPGAVLRVGRSGPVPSLTLTAPGETWLLRCQADARTGRPYWQALPALPYIQGVFSNALPGRAAYSDITVRHNLLWVTAPAAVSFRDPDDRGIAVTRNSFLRPWPGDIDGDGVPNGLGDGFNTLFNSGFAMMDAAAGHELRGNVLGFSGGADDAGNDAGLRHDDGGRSLLARFALGPDGAFSPETASAAVALARPRADGLLAGRAMGAVGPTPDQDPYDWSWVRDW